ncbi:MAG: glutamate-cysteine ligase family protein [Pirellulales bacterium]
MADDDNNAKPLGLFTAYGVELEYMIVDAASLDVRPVADEVFRAVVGEITGEYETPEVSWSNELASHVIELKTTLPAASLAGLCEAFARHVGQVADVLRPMGCRLMPGAMHPWMDPHAEMRLWPHDYGPVYAAFDRVFDCRGHGWANLQSVHLNLPFADDAEFGRLHAAIRLVLPLLPALAASSPVMDGRVTGTLDNRLDVYRTNARRVPSVSGEVVPEAVFTRADYEERIFKRMYADIGPHDPEGILQHEWLNSRGAIARFDRQAIEIRVLDIQECPAADMAIVAVIVAVLKALVAERWSPVAEQMKMASEPLVKVLHTTIRDADAAVIRDAAYLAQFGVAAVEGKEIAAGELWRRLVAELGVMESLAAAERAALGAILERGPLARRMMAVLGRSPDRAALRGLYGALCACLVENRTFQGS